MIDHFADLQFDTGRRLLKRNGRRINLTKLCFDVLKVLVEAASDLVSNDELIGRAWGSDRVITPENLAQRIHLLRESIGDEAGNPSYEVEWGNAAERDVRAPTKLGSIRGWSFLLIGKIQGSLVDRQGSFVNCLGQARMCVNGALNVFSAA